MPKIILYRNKCIGCGICYEMQPENWRMSKRDGKAMLLNATIKKDIAMLILPHFMEPKSRELALACPAKIIKVV